MGYFDLQEDLERLFGRHVDLVAKDGLHRVIRDRVLADAQVLYAAVPLPDAVTVTRLAAEASVGVARLHVAEELEPGFWPQVANAEVLVDVGAGILEAVETQQGA